MVFDLLFNSETCKYLRFQFSVAVQTEYVEGFVCLCVMWLRMHNKMNCHKSFPCFWNDANSLLQQVNFLRIHINNCLEFIRCAWEQSLE